MHLDVFVLASEVYLRASRQGSSPRYVLFLLPLTSLSIDVAVPQQLPSPAAQCVVRSGSWSVALRLRLFCGTRPGAAVLFRSALHLSQSALISILFYSYLTYFSLLWF